MAAHESTNLSDLAARVQQIAARMAGFKPALDQHLEDVDKDVGNSLSLLAGMSEYMQFELSIIGEQLSTLKQA